MYKSRGNEGVNGAKSQLYFEMDPSGRYGRFKEVLGKGAMKTVYRAFDEVLGMEVAWNQVKLNCVLQSPDELQRLYSEVHLLKNINHDSIMKFHTSWIDVDRRTFNFITEMFTSGSLREYIRKYRRVNIRAVKDWSRQILEGVAYLHGHDPPVIHRDLKCDNVFVNGHLGQVKIGDLGLAATLRESHHCHSVIGTPEFMAPELYEEDYNELVDVYSFGMCVLEMLTSEYPYSECSNPAQIYKKVSSGKLPKAFFQIEDGEAKRFIGRCLESASTRPSANELLLDPFITSIEDVPVVVPKLPCEIPNPNETKFEKPNLSADPTRTTEMTITGTLNAEDDTIFLKVQISNKDGQARNIYFPFDISSDTALDVAAEMVKELDITDWETLEIAEMINDEISALVPNHHQNSFTYYDDDDDDDKTQHPFYAFSSHSSSATSLPGIFTSCETRSLQENSLMASDHDWAQENLLIDDDTSSQSSLNSHKYANVYFSSGNVSDYDLSSIRGELDSIGKTHNNTRFCPEDKTTKSSNKHCDRYLNIRKALKSNQQMTRTGSLVDVRSQLLHRSLVEELSKRRLFNTVGAIENIGYHEPPGKYSSKMLVTGGFSASFQKCKKVWNFYRI